MLLQVEWFQLYLACQEEEGFVGSFPAWLQEQVGREASRCAQGTCCSCHQCTDVVDGELLHLLEV
jgi:hypothetical protein